MGEGGEEESTDLSPNLLRCWQCEVLPIVLLPLHSFVQAQDKYHAVGSRSDGGSCSNGSGGGLEAGVSGRAMSVCVRIPS